MHTVKVTPLGVTLRVNTETTVLTHPMHVRALIDSLVLAEQQLIENMERSQEAELAPLWEGTLCSGC